MITVLGVLTDGRADYLAQTMDTVDRLGTFDHRFIIDDSANPDYTKWLRETYLGWKVHGHHERRGLAASVQDVWEHALDLDADYLFHLEEDFLICDDIDVPAMRAVLEGRRDISQMVLKRQPITAPEVMKNDLLGGMGVLDVQDGWTIQEHIFSLNPCLIPRWVLGLGWPAGNEAEMTTRLLGQGFRFGVWGWLGSPALVHHIGESRSAGWKL